MKAKSLVLGLFIGGAAASISTLLTAPVSGKDARQYVKKNAECLKIQLVELKKQIRQLSNSVVIATKEGKATISAFSSEIKSSINSWKQDIQPHQQKIQTELNAIEAAIQELEANLNKYKAE